MNKRSFLKSVLGQNSEQEALVMSPSPVSTTLNPYSGSWEKSQALHLLTRCSFGPTRTALDESLNLGFEATVEKLFEAKATFDPPIYYNFQNDPLVPNGETWVLTPPDPSVQGLFAARRRSLASWFAGLMIEGGTSVTEKMMLFWHEHFAINNINRGQYAYHYINIIERNALGNFRTMLEEMTIDPAMLLFLNGNENTKESPNENYARELLELFSIGRGEDVGGGDYTNYTEVDVAELARALTGWRPITLDDGTVQGIFINSRHDTDTKQLSHRFDNVIIENGGADEYKTVIDIILQKQEVARFICRQLHIWFVGKEITSEVEGNVIEPMSQILFDNDYEILPALKSLILSEYFNDSVHHGCMVNSPMDFIIKSVTTMDLELPSEIIQKYFFWNRIQQFSALQDMALFNLPIVAGWKAYYQSPQYYQYWINSVTLNFREDLINALIQGYNTNGMLFRYDFIKYIENIPDASDPNVLIDEISNILFVLPISQNQKDYLKEVLIPGLPDFEWTVEYSEFLVDPDDEAKRNAINNKLTAMFNVLLKMPEFYLY